ncbi:DUF5080 family protein [Staphylococcus aureus]|nr:DUF5080 family protein [Staphylococcus aureus]
MKKQELDLQTSKIRGIYFFIIAIALLIITKLRIQPGTGRCYMINPFYFYRVIHFNLASTGYI